MATEGTPLLVARGTATGLILAMPAAFIQTVLSGQDPKPQAAINVLFLLVILGFVLAGWATGKAVEGQAAKLGMVAALFAFVPVEVVAVLSRLDRGDPVRLLGIIFVGLFAAVAGTIGGQLGAARRNRGTT